MSKSHKPDDQSKNPSATDGQNKWANINDATQAQEDDANTAPESDTPTADESPSGGSAFEPESSVDAASDALTQQVSQLKDQLAREVAENQNQRRRLEKEKADALRFANDKILKELLPLIDSLDRAADVKADTSAEHMREGLKLTTDLLLSILQKFDVTVLNPSEGDAFDPDSHEAVSVQADQAQADGVILQVLQKGYALHGRVIRSAMVVVNRL